MNELSDLHGHKELEVKKLRMQAHCAEIVHTCGLRSSEFRKYILENDISNFTDIKAV